MLGSFSIQKQSQGRRGPLGCSLRTTTIVQLWQAQKKTRNAPFPSGGRDSRTNRNPRLDICIKGSALYRHMLKDLGYGSGALPRESGGACQRRSCAAIGNRQTGRQAGRQAGRCPSCLFSWSSERNERRDVGGREEEQRSCMSCVHFGSQNSASPCSAYGNGERACTTAMARAALGRLAFDWIPAR